jgi:5-(carboxyamino)imidazole ribonucleotide mutase
MTTDKTIAIVMGSDSDLTVMKDAAEFLEDIGIGFHLTILSAHRTPKRMLDFAEHASGSGYKVIIAGAGGAAHLPGMIASITTLPVIGVPIQLKTLSGLDSLLSIVQMPNGVPVATVAINAAKNAAILAAQILAISDPILQKRIADHKASMLNEVEDKAMRIEKLGYEKYMNSER